MKNLNHELIEAGKIVNTHGIRGELRLQPWADTPDFLTEFEYLYIGDEPVKVLSARVHKGCVIATLEGVDDIDAAIKMKNKIIKVKKEDIQLDESTYLVADLIGLNVENAETGEQLGQIKDVLSLPSNNVYVIQGKREILVPAVPEFIIETNIDEGYVKLRLIEGM